MIFLARSPHLLSMLVVCLLLVHFGAMASDTAVTIYTPEGRPVSAYIIGDGTPWYTNQDALDDIDYYGLDAEIIESATAFYNCHGYAWAKSENMGTYWIGYVNDDQETKYFSDHAYSNDDQPSYVPASSAEATHGCYEQYKDHSIRVIQSGYPVASSGARTHVSKWCSGPLVRHAPGHDIYALKDTNIISYYRLKTAHSGTLSSYPKTWIGAGNKTHTLSGNVTVPSGATLTVMGGAVVDLNGYMLACGGGSLTDVGATWLPVDVGLRLNGSLVAHYVSLPTAVTDVRLENIEADQIEVHGGAHSITSDLIIPSGATLSLNSTTLNFASGIKLRIDGALSTNGSSTLTSSGGQWYGVEFYNVYNGGTISGCTIENAQYAVYAYNTYLESPVSYNSIQYNSSGVYCSESWIRLYHNLIEYNGYGVRCASYSDPVVEPNNIIRNNQWGVHGDASSSPDLSEYTGTGYNSICWNDYYDVYSSYAGTIYAHGNWWGDYPPYPANSGNVDISDALTSDPNGWAKISPKTLDAPLSIKSLPGSSTSPDTAGIGTFDVARLLFLKGDTEQAQSRFVQLVASYPNNLAGVKSLIFLSRLMHKQNAPVKPTLQRLVSDQPGAAVGKAAKLLLVGELLHDRNNVGALEIAESLLGCGDSLFEKHALYNAGNILWYRMGDRVRGESYFRTLAKRFPGDPLAISGLAALGEQYVEPPTPKNAGEASLLPGEFALHPNHPNPFNPATSFEYDLPTPARVSAIVYDLLGREVVDLVHSVQPAGSHTVRWDASGMASGVYLLRFTIADEFGRPILNKVNKLLLTR